MENLWQRESPNKALGHFDHEYPIFDMDYRILLWALIYAVSARFSASVGTATAVLAWQLIFLILIPLIMPLKYTVATILASVVFLDVSLWFQSEISGPNTIYESPGAWIKPPELLLVILVLKTSVYRRRTPRIAGSIKNLCIAWLGVVILGGMIAVHNGIPIGAILTYSEMRSPFVAVVMFIFLAPLIRANRRFFIDCIGWMVLAHFLVSLVSWATGFSLLWQSYASNYAGSQAAFFGADESVMVYLLAQAFAFGCILCPGAEELTRSGRIFWFLVLGVSTFAVVTSLRRGGVLASAVLVLFVFVFAPIERKIRLVSILLLAAPILLILLDRNGALMALAGRLSGEGSAAISDAGHESDVAEAARYVSAHFWFGTGPGTRLELSRTEAYGVSDSLAVHHSLYYIWIRYGIAGAFIYVGLFCVPVLKVLQAALRGNHDRDSKVRQIMSLCMAGLLAGIFIWGLNTPAVFINFRQAGIWIIATGIIYATLPGPNRPPSREGFVLSHNPGSRPFNEV